MGNKISDFSVVPLVFLMMSTLTRIEEVAIRNVVIMLLMYADDVVLFAKTLR